MPTYAVMVLAAVISEEHLGKGPTLQTIEKKISALHNGCNTPALRTALKKLVDSGAVEQNGQRFKVTTTGRMPRAAQPKVMAKNAITKVAQKSLAALFMRPLNFV
jgi:hypothetical protein